MARLSVNINDECAAIIRAGKARGVTETEQVRRALGILDLIEKAQAANEPVYIDRSTGRVQLVLLDP